MGSKQLYDKACHYIPGGVNSPVRAFKNVDMTPVFIRSAHGSHIVDEDGHDYIDYIGSWGPMILGHGHPCLIDHLEDELNKGMSFGLSTAKEVTLAQMICEAYPAVEMVRMVNSGTEATMSAIRVARGYTQKNKIIKFEGNYHGHSDSLLVKAGSGALTFSTPTSPGVIDDVVKNTIVCQYNSLQSVMDVVEQDDDIACIILEPVACNMGLIEAKKDFLIGLRNLCTQKGIVLIFDEVITGFRLSYGGAAQYYSVHPDMACFGKIIGGGLPVGAYGGKKELMSLVSPQGPVYQAGTLSGNPLAMEVGIRQLTYLKNHPEVYSYIHDYALSLKKELDQMIKEHHYPCQVHCCGSLLTLFFKEGKIESYQDVLGCDLDAFRRFYQVAFQKGLMLAPSQFEGIFIGYSHTSDDFKKTIHIMKESLEECFS